MAEFGRASSLDRLVEAVRESRSHKPWRERVAELRPFTDFERTLWEEGVGGEMQVRFPYQPVFTRDAIIGYYTGSSGCRLMFDRRGNVVFAAEVGLESPLLDPIDLLPAGKIAGVVSRGVRPATRALGKAGRATGSALCRNLRSASTMASEMVSIGARRIHPSGLVRKAVDKMKATAAKLRTLKPATTTDDVFREISEELGLDVAQVTTKWHFPGSWSKVKDLAYRAIFGVDNLPFNSPGKVKVSVHHIVEKWAGGKHSTDNLVPLLQRVHAKVSGIYSRNIVISGERIPLRKWMVETLSPEERRGVGYKILFECITKTDDAELKVLMKQTPMFRELL
jgi:hypothetical protein